MTIPFECGFENLKSVRIKLPKLKHYISGQPESQN